VNGEQKTADVLLCSA